MIPTSRHSASPTGKWCWPVFENAGPIFENQRVMLAMSRTCQLPDRHAQMIAAEDAPEAIADLCHLEPLSLPGSR